MSVSHYQAMQVLQLWLRQASPDQRLEVLEQLTAPYCEVCGEEHNEQAHYCHEEN